MKKKNKTNFTTNKNIKNNCHLENWTNRLQHHPKTNIEVEPNDKYQNKFDKIVKYDENHNLAKTITKSLSESNHTDNLDQNESNNLEDFLNIYELSKL